MKCTYNIQCILYFNIKIIKPKNNNDKKNIVIITIIINSYDTVRWCSIIVGIISFIKNKEKNNLWPHCNTKLVQPTYNNGFHHFGDEKRGQTTKDIGHKRILILKTIKVSVIFFSYYFKHILFLTILLI